MKSAIDDVEVQIRLIGDRPVKKQQKSCFLLMQISYPYIVWNNVQKLHENRASSFWAMLQSMCVIVVSPR